MMFCPHVHLSKAWPNLEPSTGVPDAVQGPLAHSLPLSFISHLRLRGNILTQTARRVSSRVCLRSVGAASTNQPIRKHVGLSDGSSWPRPVESPGRKLSRAWTW